MIAGEVGKVRELEAGVQADVCIGMSASGTAVVKVTGTSPAVKEALAVLKKALKQEAHDLIVGAQLYQQRRNRAAIGVEE